MAEDTAENNASGGEAAAECPKCEICVPGLPGWMATFSDLVTLLLTFFVLLLSFAKTESAKYEAALGSIRNAFGGNVLKQGEVLEPGKSPDNQPTMLESQEPIKPFPIDFLTMEGILDKHELNKNSEEDLKQMKSDLADFSLSENVNIYEMTEGIKVFVKDQILFQKGSTKPLIQGGVKVEVLDKIIQMMSEKDWTLYVMGHASRGETSINGKDDALELSAQRARDVARSLIRRGVRPESIVISSFGDTRPNQNLGTQGDQASKDRRVEFMIRKRDLETKGHKVQPY